MNMYIQVFTEKLHHLRYVQNFTIALVYETILDEISQIRIWNITNEMIEFPEGFVKNFNESNNFSLEFALYDYEDSKYFAKAMALYKKIGLFKFKKIGSFISYMQSYFKSFGYDEKANLAKLMTLNDMEVDLLLISKLFSLNDFNNLKDDPKLDMYEPLEKCVKHVLMKTQENSFVQSPCIDVNKNLMCQKFCEWHNKMIIDQLSKGELKTLMRYLQRYESIVQNIFNKRDSSVMFIFHLN